MLLRTFLVAFLLFLSTGCATHRLYETSQFREKPIKYKEVTLNRDGLSKEQIEVISSTEPPNQFPVDISIMFIKSGYINQKVEDIFTYNLIKELKESSKIGRVILIPEFLVPQQIGFMTIQELGVRSLSEYVLVFYLGADEVFTWTTLYKSKYEINSTISFILVDSFTSAMLTSDKLFSAQEYEKSLLKPREQEEAQKQIFSEQAKLLGRKIDALFSDVSNTII